MWETLLVSSIWVEGHEPVLGNCAELCRKLYIPLISTWVLPVVATLDSTDLAASFSATVQPETALNMIF